MTAKVVLKRGKAGPILRGYPWVFEGWIERIQGEVGDGEAADLLDWRQSFIGRGLFNGASKIRLRIFSREAEAVFDRDLLQRRLEGAIGLREDLLRLQDETDAYRLVHSDGDGLSGLVVDRYGEFLVIQISSLGMERRRDIILEVLQEKISPRGIFERQDGRSRRREGISPVEGVLSGSPPPSPLKIREGGVRFLVDIARGQKTGFFLDQRENRKAAARFARGGRVLDVFCYTGAFGITAALEGGATSVVGIESSAKAIDLADRSAALNGAESVTVMKKDAFEELRRLAEEESRFDLVILDPPKFSPSRKDKSGALRAYREVNLQALKMVSPGGVLVTCSCSASMSDHALEGVVAAAGVDAGREIQILQRRGQGPDHPVVPGFPEGQYLTCLILRVI